MKPVSGDLLLKIALGLGAVVALAYVLRRTTGAAAAAVSQVIPYINPADGRNVVHSGVNQIGAAITGDPDFNLGGFIYELTHDDPVNPPAPPNISDYQSAPIDVWDASAETVYNFNNNPRPFTGGATGGW